MNFYNLDAIIAVGYRVNSKKATEFRIWATKILKEYMTKGFALNAERFIRGNKYDTKYFDELLERIKQLELAKEFSKYNAIKKLADYLNIKNEEIIAFGDGLNDINMIKNCGNGVAMNNALSEVKGVADYVTKEDYNNGLIKFLREYLNV